MSLWEKNLRKVVPYVPGEQPKSTGIIKLNTNENPYPPSPRVNEVIKGFDYNTLRKYPDPDVTSLVDAISDYYGVNSSSVFAGVGSDDVLAMAFMTFFNGNDPVLFPDISYSFYEVWAECFGTDAVKIPLKDDFSLDMALFDRKCQGIVIPNPNAPTSLAEPIESFEMLAKNHPEAVIIIDEAYVDFGAETALPLIDKYDNILVVRTFSKSRSLAGSRLGYAIGSEKLIAALNAVKSSVNSYTIDSLSMAIGKAAIEDREYFEETVNKVIATRERTIERLKGLGFNCLDSKTNFIFASHPALDAAETNQALRDEKIFVRYFPKGRTKDYLRITVGTDEEMDTLIAFFEKMLK